MSDSNSKRWVFEVSDFGQVLIILEAPDWHTPVPVLYEGDPKAIEKVIESIQLCHGILGHLLNPQKESAANLFYALIRINRKKLKVRQLEGEVKPAPIPNFKPFLRY